MLDEREIQIKERIQERYDITEQIYSAWFIDHSAVLLPRNRFYQKENIEKYRAISYLLDRGYIVAQPVENDPETVAVTITPDGIDYYEQGYLNGKANGFQVVEEIKNTK
ncbi:hypothetical protein [Paenibacillus xylanexedens]|uniref:hypothetical protein n=1 Tax=Paenibacillus xylanexedens TaxID=528191 RepID=UPI003CFC3F99